MKLEQITEATLNINTLVDYIYKEAFKDFIEEIQNYKLGRKVRINKIHLKTMEFSPKTILNATFSPSIKQAIMNLPITIYTGAFTGGSQYMPTEGKIFISFNNQANDILTQSVGYERYHVMLDKIPKHMLKNFEQETSGVKVKSTIAHELSHWIRDAKHGKQISKMVNAAHKNPSKSRRILNRGTGDDYLTDYEMDALIHGIKETKRAYPQDEWDSFTFQDLFDIDPSVNVLQSGFKGSQRRQFMKLLISRMHRERLLGKRMKAERRF